MSCRPALCGFEHACGEYARFLRLTGAVRARIVSPISRMVSGRGAESLTAPAAEQGHEGVMPAARARSGARLPTDAFVNVVVHEPDHRLAERAKRADSRQFTTSALTFGFAFVRPR